MDVEACEGDPLEVYRITYRIPSLRVDEATQCPVEVKEPVVPITFHKYYPREAPLVRFMGDVFRPNVQRDGGVQIDVGHLGAGNSIVDLIIDIDETVHYRSYSLHPPCNPTATRWVEEHADLLPFGAVDLARETKGERVNPVIELRP